jgi:hypothetical protein
MMKLNNILTLISCAVIFILVGYVRLSNIVMDHALTQKEMRASSILVKPKGRRRTIHHSSESRVTHAGAVIAKSSLNDQTLDWDPTVNRAWLNQKTKSPPAMLLLTSYGWNHENRTFGREVFRNIRTRELVNGVINHPWFHPTAWQDINSGKMKLSNSTRYYVFLDKHSCGEKNYPKYGKGLDGVMLNRDELYGRGRCCLEQKNHFTSEVMASQVMRGNSVFVLFDCTGIGPVRKPEFKRDRRRYPGRKLAFVSVSSVKSDLYADHDQGLVPPALLKCSRPAITSHGSCQPRPILLSFAGKIMRASARIDLETINNNKDVLVGGWEKPPVWMNMNANETAKAFLKLASLTSFGATPRGKRPVSRSVSLAFWLYGN